MDKSFFVTIHAFDRQTDRQTDGQRDRILIARPRLHCMQRGNKTAIYAALVDIPLEFSHTEIVYVLISHLQVLHIVSSVFIANLVLKYTCISDCLRCVKRLFN